MSGDLTTGLGQQAQAGFVFGDGAPRWGIDLTMCAYLYPMYEIPKLIAGGKHSAQHYGHIFISHLWRRSVVGK